MNPTLQLQTLFQLDGHGRILSTREPAPAPGPLFVLISGRSDCVWAIRSDVPEPVAAEIARLVSSEPPLLEPRAIPVHADRYLSLLPGRTVSGPAFSFPELIHSTPDLVLVSNLLLLERHFREWTAAEIPRRWPILSVTEAGYPVSVCFSARLSDTAAEAGVETAPSFRGRGLAARVTAGWALTVRESGRVPLCSTEWTNTASLAVARKLDLAQYATDWSIVEH